MMRKRTEGENFSVDTSAEGPAFSEISGVVSGEIGHVEPVEAEPESPEAERLRMIEMEARKDAMLAQIFDDTVMDDPRERAGAILDRLNALRRDLDRSDVDPEHKRERDLWLSDIVNRLRELL